MSGDEHVVPFDLDGVYGDGARGGKAGRLAGAQVEAGAVQPALDLAVLDLALGERDVRVRADVVDREHLALGADDRDRRAVELDPLRGVLVQLAQRRRRVGTSEGGHQTDASSSASIFAIRRSSRSGQADLLDQLAEEAADHQAAGLVVRDAAGHQVEQLLVVEPAGGRLAWPAPTISPVSISRFGTESARAPSVRTRLRFIS